MGKAVKGNNAPPMFFKIGTVKPSYRKKQCPDLQPTFERRLGEFIDTNNHPVYTSIKVYCKEPDWEHPNFTYKIQLANGASSQPVFASVPPDELHELISGLIYWLKENKEQHNEMIEKSRELLKRHEIAKQHESILSDLTLDTEEIEGTYTEAQITRKEIKHRTNAIMNFLNYFYKYFEQTNPIHKRQCLDYMLSLLPNHTDEIINLINMYKEHPEYLEIDKPKIQETLLFYFQNRDIEPQNLENQLNIIKPNDKIKPL